MRVTHWLSTGKALTRNNFKAGYEKQRALDVFYPPSFSPFFTLLALVHLEGSDLQYFRSLFYSL